MEERRPAAPAPDAGPRTDDLEGPPPDGPPRGGHAPDGPPRGGLPPDAEVRPIGALLIVGFLTLTILVSWYGMFALNLVRN